MVLRFSYTIFLLPCLFLLMFGKANSVEHHHHQHQFNMSEEMSIFTIEDVRAMDIGKKLPLFFPIRDLSLFPPFLPKHISDTIPFSSSHIPDILARFSLSPDSPKANAVKETLKKCETPGSVGEIKTCATSMEDLLSFLTETIGPEPDFNYITTRHPTLKTKILQNYTVLERPRRVPFPKKVSCHPSPYVYAVYYCHFEVKGTEAFKVSLVGDESGDRVDALIVCHLDTSEWNPNHFAFKLLGVKPGESTICHVFGDGHMVWFPRSSLPAAKTTTTKL